MFYQRLKSEIEQLASYKLNDMIWLDVEEVEDVFNSTCLVINDSIIVRKTQKPGVFEIKIECSGTSNTFPMIGDINLIVDIAVSHIRYREGARVLK